jgi:hypothetical protein
MSAFGAAQFTTKHSSIDATVCAAECKTISSTNKPPHSASLDAAKHVPKLPAQFAALFKAVMSAHQPAFCAAFCKAFFFALN